MILRNLDPRNGVCNGTRGIVTRCRNRVLEVELLSGDHAGKKGFHPKDQLPAYRRSNTFQVSQKAVPSQTLLLNDNQQVTRTNCEACRVGS